MGQPRDINSPIDLRVGVDVEGFKGVQTEKDPGGIDRTALQRAYNVRNKAGRLVSRGGQELVISTPIDGPWEGLCDVQGGAGDGTLRLYVSAELAPFDAILVWV